MNDSTTSSSARWRRARQAVCLALLFAACTTGRAAEPLRCEFDKGETLALRFTPAGLPLLDGAINGQPVTFLLDTGASTTNLLRPRLEALKIPVAKPRSSTQGIGGAAPRSITRLKTMDFGPVHLDKPYFYVLDGLHPSLAGQFDAIFGMEELMANDIEIDIPAARLTIFKGHCAKDSQVSWDKGAFELPMNVGRTDLSPAQFSVRIQGQTVKAFFDTGAAASILDAGVAATLGLTPKPGGRTGNQFLIGQDYIRHHRLLLLPAQGRILVTGGSTVPVRLSEQP